MAAISDYPTGYRRENWPQLWGWAEFMAAADRTDYAMRYLRANFPDFPEPVAVLTFGPVYLARECEAFLATHPKQRRSHLSEYDIRRMLLMSRNGVGANIIAEVIGCSTMSVYRHVNKRKRS